MATAKQLKALRKARKKLTKHPKRFVKKGGKTAGKTISRGARKKYATIKETKKGPRGGTKRFRFPIPPGDKAAARNALARLPQSKGLSQEEKNKIIRRACKELGGGNEGRYNACLVRHGLKKPAMA